MKVVSDASPLIFLGKIKKLPWLKTILKGPFYLPSLVKEELFPKTISLSEEEYLSHELSDWQTMPWRPKALRADSGLSAADLSVLEIARKVKAGLVLADEKALRAILAVRRQPTLGTLGIILTACRQKRSTASEARQLVEELISTHRFRVSAHVYMSFLKALAAIR